MMPQGRFVSWFRAQRKEPKLSVIQAPEELEKAARNTAIDTEIDTEIELDERFNRIVNLSGVWEVNPQLAFEIRKEIIRAQKEACIKALCQIERKLQDYGVI